MEPLTLNRYAYGVNNPVMNTDPSGHWPKWLSSVTKKVTSAVSSAWSSTKKFVSKAASTVGNAISNAVKEVKSWVAPINENKSNVKTTAENNVYNFKGSLRNTYQNIQQQSKPAITTRDYPIEVVRANMESVKNSCESAQYVKSQKYEYKDKITSAPQTGRSFAAGVGVSLGKNLAVGPMIDVMTAIGLFGESIGTSIKGTGFGVRSDLKQGEENLENFIIYNFVTDQKSYLAGKIVGDAASTVIGVAELLIGIPKILVGGIAMTGGILTAQTVVGPIVLGGGGAAVAAVGVAETSYGIDVTYNSLSNLKNDMMSFSEIAKGMGNTKVTAGKNFKDHFIRHKGLLENITDKKYSKYKTHGDEFLEDIGKIIDDGTVKYQGKGTLKKGQQPVNVYRGNGITVVTKESGEFVTIIESGKGLDLGIQMIE